MNTLWSTPSVSHQLLIDALYHITLQAPCTPNVFNHGVKFGLMLRGRPLMHRQPTWGSILEEVPSPSSCHLAKSSLARGGLCESSLGCSLDTWNIHFSL